MAKLLLALLSILLPCAVFGQPTWHRPPGGLQQERCLEAEVKQQLRTLRRQHVDSLFTVRHYFEQGGFDHVVAYVVWQHAGQGQVRTLRGCGADQSSQPFPTQSLFAFYQQHQLATLPELVVTHLHDPYLYSVEVTLPGLTHAFVLQEYQRQPSLSRPLLPGETPTMQAPEPRSMWVSLFEQSLP
ncbi:hypothetical protein [Hymenobacter siberiensis]|uniref:hypothetical protein n=1 Tax=Hymenobacter siberiensis TaxID=2848396 RepID=UPI001C1DE0C3|nr:hypothetical protein [Hymenobacter siberiensis]